MTDRPEVKFISDCGDSSPIEREALIRRSGLLVERHRGSSRRSIYAKIFLDSDYHTLVINLKGTFLSHQVAKDGWHVTPPQSLVYASSPAQMLAHIARGDHERLLLVWHHSESAGLSRWITEMIRERGLGNPYISPILPQHRATVELVVRACSNAGPSSEPVILGCAHELLAVVMTADHDFCCLATIPPEVPDSVAELLRQVKENPVKPWSLKDASALAGYSPFHLSRTFKALVGYGFPEFVDRSRAELAIKQLGGTDDSLDEVATATGFGSTHALRESIKEYLGLLPSELRALPQDFLF